ncbi:MAG: tRNA preQ1(34) S-adenosylmethionine ribosyltransferase-isomerase QueA [Nanoarchaeota archaeon]|nr:tRNA preQ1(34) S-adenosylmethionine ribosyltransferase-isomerase QueA [Nanoarchaeota archaeon]MBU1704114.1 tRNA preQ1(34) S-adenosylmethionine ribosyltransferase-isomerase QueA [Nanoarchaeota archaeon]
MEINDFDYNLPTELISQKAVTPKDHSRLMVVTKEIIEHKHFYDILEYLEKGDVLVINETKVSKAKILGQKLTGSKIQLILTERIDERAFKARIQGNKIKVGQIYEFNDNLICDVTGQSDDIFEVKFNKPITKEVLEKSFILPTPPYVKRVVPDQEYQTVYSKKTGSLAAPTAGLHFTDELLEKIKAKSVLIAKVCLHIDFGTFLPVRGAITEHKMHREYFEIDKETADMINNRKGKLVAVGTTSVRALESSADDQGKIIPQKSYTEIFIYPGYKFKTKIDALITNFHLPKSTLLMLVSAYFGRERILEAYKEAVQERYRFYSLGDACLLVL